MIYVQIKDLEQLKSAAADPLECFIKLSGSLRSSKQINYDAVRDLWDVYNEIDDSSQEDLSFGDLKHDTHIVEALEKGALWATAWNLRDLLQITGMSGASMLLHENGETLQTPIPDDKKAVYSEPLNSFDPDDDNYWETPSASGHLYLGPGWNHVGEQ